MLFFRQKKKDPSQPRRGWPWNLAVGMEEPLSSFSWKDLEAALRALTPDPDSFVILEQTNPRDGGQYWYLQCAVVPDGPHAGEYVVGCGFQGEKQTLLELRCPSAEQAVPLFQAAYRRRPVDLTAFEDRSDQLEPDEPEETEPEEAEEDSLPHKSQEKEKCLYEREHTVRGPH